MRKLWWILAIVLVLIGVLGYLFWSQLFELVFRPTASRIEDGISSNQAVSVVAKNLMTPWSIAKLPNGNLLVTERSGQMRQIGEQGQIYPIDGVTETGEGGLLGLALHPEFANNQQLYVYYTKSQGAVLTNQVDRYTLRNRELRFDRVIIEGIPAASNHNGGAVAFGPDRKLYITTGDAAEEQTAQDTSSLAGKILRVNDDGSMPADNPFSNKIWSYGHRNPQGLAWDEEGRLWSTEHGPSGAATGRDELNLIEKGANYGWPLITGDETGQGMKAPVAQSGDNETWAPAGLAYMDGSLYFAGLRGQSLYRAKINSDASVSLSKYFSQQYGRLRAVLADGENLYVSTSNRDGRGSPKPDDDQILFIKPSLLR